MNTQLKATRLLTMTLCGKQGTSHLSLKNTNFTRSVENTLTVNEMTLVHNTQYRHVEDQR
jgi:hypothetical protein